MSFYNYYLKKNLARFIVEFFGMYMQILTIPLNNDKATSQVKSQIVKFVEAIQVEEFKLPIKSCANQCILNAQTTYNFQDKSFFWYVQDDDGSVIGTIGLKALSANKMELKKFFVLPKYRGKGLAHNLHLTAIDAAKEMSIENLFLGTVNELKAAHRFYEKNGYEQITQDSLPLEFQVGFLDTVFFRKNL